MTAFAYALGVVGGFAIGYLYVKMRDAQHRRDEWVRIRDEWVKLQQQWMAINAAWDFYFTTMGE